MRVRRLDSNHDMCFGRGVSDYLEDSVGNPNAVAQAIKTRLLLFYGEWWENITNGLPMFQQILGQNMKDKKTVDSILIDNIMGLQLPDPDNRYAVTRVINVTSEYYPEATGIYRARDYTFTAFVDTIYGELVITNEVTEQKFIPTDDFIKITQQPKSITVYEGSTATFTVIAESNTPISYQWLTRLVGAVKWTYLGDAGVYYYETPPTVKITDNQSQYRCILSNNKKTVITDIAVLTVLESDFLGIEVSPEDEAIVTSFEYAEVTFNKDVDEETITEDNLYLEMDEEE